MQTQTEAKIWGAIASYLSMVLLFLLLWFIYIDMPFSEEEEGIEVAFGDSSEGGGNMQEMPAVSEPQPSTPPPAPQEPSQNDLLTQEDEEALALERQRKQEQERQKALEQERIRKEKEEKARLEAERIAREKAIAEQKAKEQAAKDKANALMGAFGQNNDNSSGSGLSSGSTTQGNPAGHGSNPVGSGNSNGNGWSLKGRNLVGTLAKPNYDSNQEGKVVVNIRVNAEGKVISATKGQGTDISDEQVIKDACAAARKVTFTPGDGDAVGMITYIYKNK